MELAITEQVTVTLVEPSFCIALVCVITENIGVQFSYEVEVVATPAKYPAGAVTVAVIV